MPDHLAEASRRGVREAARAGHRVLASGGSAVEAVTAAVKVLEDDPAFDAGARMEDAGLIVHSTMSSLLSAPRPRLRVDGHGRGGDGRAHHGRGEPGVRRRGGRGLRAAPRGTGARRHGEHRAHAAGGARRAAAGGPGENGEGVM